MHWTLPSELRNIDVTPDSSLGPVLTFDTASVRVLADLTSDHQAMKILCTTPDFHHPLVPGSHRHFHFIRELAKRHEITWLTLARKPVPERALDEMQGFTSRMEVFRAYEESPSPQGKADRAVLRRAISALCSAAKEAFEQQDFDVMLFHGQELHHLLDFCPVPVVVDICDANSMRIRNQARYAPLSRLPRNVLSYLRTRRRERKLLSKGTRAAFISERDRAAVVGNSRGYEVVPNGVDVEFWSSNAQATQANAVILTGDMSYPPNADAAVHLIRRIMPVLRARTNRPELLIVGRAPTAQLLGEAAGCDDVTVTGFVEDVRPWMQRGAVFAAPIRFASGMQNKVLEAMAMKVPVVTSPVVAEGITVAEAEDRPVKVADPDDAEAFADEVLSLLQDPRGRAELGDAGRAYVERHFSWQRSARKLERLCEEASGVGR